MLRPADYDIILESIMTALASTVVFFSLTTGFLNEPGVFIGYLLTLTAAGIYVSSIRQTTEEDVESECVTRVGKLHRWPALKLMQKNQASLSGCICSGIGRICALCIIHNDT